MLVVKFLGLISFISNGLCSNFAHHYPSRATTNVTPSRRKAQATGSSDVYTSRLQSYIVAETLHRDNASCYTAGIYVPRGVPLKTVNGNKAFGCGYGCQWANAQIDSSSQYPGTPLSAITGPPDVYPQGVFNAQNAWASSGRDIDQIQYIHFSVATAVLVTGMDIYQNMGAGGIVQVQGRQSTSPDKWYTLWQGLPQLGIPTFYATIFSPPISAPRSIPLDEFKIFVNTMVTQGEFSQIDAVKVYGDTLTEGSPVVDIPASVQCSDLSDSGCFHQCAAGEVVTEASISNALTVLGKATAWLEKALFAQPTAKPLTIPKQINIEPVECDGITVPPYLVSQGIFGSELIIFPTIRPAAYPIEVTPCRWLNLSDLTPTVTSLPLPDQGGRPVVLHVNMAPGYADAPFLDNAVEGALQSAVDATIHMLYQALGFSTAYRPTLRARQGVLVDQDVNSGCSSTTSCTGTWSQRYRKVLRANNMRDAARVHFNDGTLNEVELESGPSASANFTRLHPRIYNGEIMTFPPYLMTWSGVDPTSMKHQFPAVFNPLVRPLRKSIISASYFLDLAYFKPDTTHLELQLWGRKQGELFSQEACSSWPATAVGTYVCPVAPGTTNFDSTQNNAPMCSFDRVYKGRCLFKTYSSAIPTPYRYFLTSSQSVDPNKGGISADLDYCPMNIIEPSTLGNDGTFVPTGNDCRVQSSTSTPFGAVYEEYGGASRCFGAVIPIPGGGQTNAIGCFRHQCTASGDLYVSVGGIYVKCPPAGGQVSIDASKLTQCTGNSCPSAILCPQAQDLCDPFSGDVPPSLQIYGLPSGINDTKVTISIDTANFNIGTDGILALYINGNLHEQWASPPPADANQPVGVVFRRTLTIDSLPAGNLDLSFQLTKSLDSDPVFVLTASMVVQQLNVKQWVSAVLANSSYYTSVDLTRDGDRPPSAIIGPNDLNAYGTSSRAWSPARGGGGTEFIVVKYGQAVYPRFLDVYESFAPGGTTAVYALNAETGAYVRVWKGLQPSSIDRSRLPSNPPSIARRLQLMPIDFKADTFRIELTTPPWTEIDAAQLIGDLTRLGDLEVGSDIEIEPVVPYGGTRNFTAMAVYNGDATVYYSTSTDQPWLSVEPAAGLLTANSNSLSLNLVADSSKIDLTSGYRFTANVEVTDLSTGAIILTFPVTVAVEAAEAPSPWPNPLCYNGVLQPGNRTNAPVCICEPGAYGFACEFLQCPKNCTTDGVAGGICDARTGSCLCSDNYFGPDCSGHRGGCYISYDGDVCLPGYTKGQYMINAEDENNLNRGVGNLPDSMRCVGGSQAEGNPFGCAQNVMIDLCCKSPSVPQCPFEAGSLPCTAPACAAQDYKNATCLSVVQGYCFFALHDPACRDFRPAPPPSAFCPLSLALTYCSQNPEDDACASIVPRALFGCGFKDTPNDPCKTAACTADVASPACLAAISNYCVNVDTTDGQCAYFGAGPSDCPFIAGAAPCLEPACFDANYDEAVCQLSVVTYCNSTMGAADPECARRGLTAQLPSFLQPFGSSARVNQLLAANLNIQAVLQASGLVPGYAKQDLITCPWDAVTAQCAVTPDAASCTLLQLLGVIPKGPAPGLPFSISQLYASEQVEAAQHVTAFTNSTRSIDTMRITKNDALRLLQMVFEQADKDQDGLLSLGEIYGLATSELNDDSFEAIVGALQVGASGVDDMSFFARIESVDAFAAALRAGASGEGQFITRAEYFQIAEKLIGLA